MVLTQVNMLYQYGAVPLWAKSYMPLIVEILAIILVLRDLKESGTFKNFWGWKVYGTVFLVSAQVAGSVASAILNHREAAAAPIVELATQVAGLSVVVWLTCWNFVVAVAQNELAVTVV